MFSQLLFSCSQDEIIDNSIESKKNESLQKISDVDVFKGIIFFEGPISNSFPEFKDLNFRTYIDNKDDINKMVDFQNTLIAAIQKSNPNFFHNFRNDVTSGDYYKVRNAIKNAGIEIKNQTLKMAGLSESDYINLQKSVLNKVSTSIELNKKITKEDISKIAKEVNTYSSTQNTSSDAKLPDWLAVDLWVVIYGAVAVAVAAVLAAVVGVTEETPSTESKSINQDNFYNENLYSEVTVKLEGI